MLPDEISPTADDTTPLSLTEAANAYAGASETEEPDEGQPEVEDAPEGETEANEDDAPDPDGEDEETVDGEPEDEGQAEDEQDEETEEVGQGRFAADNAKVRITNPDGTVEIVSVADLKNGNLRDRDYRQKTMEAAEVRKTYEAKSSAVEQREKQLEEQRDYVISLVKSILPPQPDPAKADPRSPSYDPAGYQAEEVAYRSWASHLTHLETEKQRTEQERQAKTADETKERVVKEWNTALEKLPELKDAKRLEAFGKDTLKFGAEYGYTPQEIANIHHDHRQLLVIKDAIAWRKLQAAKAKIPEKIKGKPPVQKGGTRLDPSQSKARDSRVAMDALNKTGRFSDGVAALLALEGKG
jgi:hypothetical protein